MEKRRPQNPQPAPNGRIIDRPRLLTKIEESKAKTILLVAPAGYGKSTLLRQAIADSVVPILVLTPRHDDLAVVARSIARLLSPSCRHMRQSVEDALKESALASERVQSVANAIANQVAPNSAVCLAIDDYHRLRTGSPGESLIEILESGQCLKLMLAARTRPAWATTRRLLYGEITEISQADLALTEDETAEVLGPTRYADVARREADGWPVLVGIVAFADGAGPISRRELSRSLVSFLDTEIFAFLPKDLRHSLILAALLPSFSVEALAHVIGTDSMQRVLDSGLAYDSEGYLALHPTLRTFFGTKAFVLPSTGVLEQAISLSLVEGHWDTAFALVKRSDGSRYMTELITRSFVDLVETGRIETLRAFGIEAANKGSTPHYLLDLIDAELAFREGSFARARRLALEATAALADDHPLKARAYVLAGMSSHMSWDLSDAIDHLSHAIAVSRRARDRNDAALARCVSALFLEDDRLPVFMGDLSTLTDTTAEDRIRVLMARQSFARLMGGLYDIGHEAEAAHALLADITNPLVRTGWGNTFGYTQILQARYQEASVTLASALAEVNRYGLHFARPHLQWSLAAAEFGLRRFAHCEGLLRHVEEAARETRSTYLEVNARSLRARLMLALGRSDTALTLTEDDFPSLPARAMAGEYLATRALALAVAGRADEASATAGQATGASQAVEVRVLSLAARTVASIGAPDSGANAEALVALAATLSTWDGLVCAVRAAPALAPTLAAVSSYRNQLLHVLTGSRDANIAFAAGLTTKRPYSKSGPLSPREVEVLDLLAKGLRTSEIAAALYIVPSTVKKHVTNIFQKLDVHTRAEAVARYADTST